MVGFSNSTGQLDLADYYRQLERRVARLERGTSGSPSTDTTTINTLAIVGLALATQTVVVDGNNYRVFLRYSWTAVPNDPSELNKDALDGYLTSYSVDGVHWTAELFTTDTFVDVGPFTQSMVVTFRVRARSIKGTLGAFSSITNTTTADNTAPFQPATPSVLPYLGQLAVTWSGLDVSSNQMPTDFAFCEVHLSTTGPTFTPSVTNLVGTILRGGGTWVVTDLPYGTLQYARLVALDTVGNRSVASTAGSGTPVQAADGDIAALGVGKLTAGVISAIMTITGRLATALTGTRVEMNINGIQAFNVSGQQTLDISATTGNVAIAGTFKTAFSGVRLEMTNSTDRSTIEFYGTAVVPPAFINSPTDVNGSPRLGLNTGPFFMNGQITKSRLFLNNGDIQLENFMDPSGVIQGAKFHMTGTTCELEIRNTSSVISGGHLEMGTGALKINVQNSGTVVSELALFSDGSWWVTGSWSKDNPIGGKSAVICGSNNATANLTHGITYGATMASRPQVVYGLQNGSVDFMHRLDTFNTTGFDVTLSSSQAVNMNYWCFKTI